MTAVPKGLTEVEPHVYYLDSRKGGGFGVSGVYLIVGDGVTLIETGTSPVAPQILDAVREIGCQEKEIARCIVTHIHLDHAGATGWLVRRLPHMEVIVHPRGASHLVDPSRLIESAATVYGSVENVTALHGEILPVPSGNVIPVADGQISVGRKTPLTVMDTPGHAFHHLCVLDPESGCLFAGEALGHYIPESGLLNPAVAPPAFDYLASKETMRKLAACNPRTICFSQFGYHRDPLWVFAESARQLDFYYEKIRQGLKNGRDTEGLISEMAREQGSWGMEEGPSDSMLRSFVLGFRTYLQRMGEIG